MSASDDDMSPDASPDILAANVKPDTAAAKRVNKLPLFIFAGVIVAVVVATTYTMADRQKKAELQETTAPAVLPVVAQAAAPPVRPDRDARPDGFIEPAGGLTAQPTDKFGASGPPQRPEDSAGELVDTMPTDQRGASQATTVTPQEPSAAERAKEAETAARAALVAQIQQQKLEQLRAALIGDSKLEVRTQSRAAAGPQAGSVGGPAAAGGDVASTLAALGLPPMDNSPLDPAAGQNALAAAGLAGGAGMGAGAVDRMKQGQADKRAFLAQSTAAENYLQSTRELPISQHELKAGAVMPSVLISGINSDMPGQVIAQVRENVYDTATGRTILIPQGARLIGTYDNGVTFGQRRALAGWTRVIYPDGSSLSLGMMPGADGGGYAGFKDKVDNHYGRTFGSAVLVSMFAAGIQLSQPNQQAATGSYDSQQIVAGELGRQLGQLGMEQAQRNFDVAPTIKIRPGYRFNVMVTKDIVLPPWRGR
ncbi:TrbI/VirB10 family protein [Xanthomonas perforans]|uniref:TrbI/VirB10 family protein n=1 Tax=Xanthomonas perforans TaxID=442694 RepID=UPI0023581C75|nr:TrbI/VirB10 family protein [Xanthomonas perforans]MDC9654343.1 TrbI/VirB10 family protein [Xanthomonas perforans]MEB2158976.1 TrbI/VirB10 family protein [Xanthomonas campestris pv. campestris]